MSWGLSAASLSGTDRPPSPFPSPPPPSPTYLFRAALLPFQRFQERAWSIHSWGERAKRASGESPPSQQRPHFLPAPGCPGSLQVLLCAPSQAPPPRPLASPTSRPWPDQEGGSWAETHLRHRGGPLSQAGGEGPLLQAAETGKASVLKQRLPGQTGWVGRAPPPHTSLGSTWSSTLLLPAHQVDTPPPRLPGFS